MPRKLLIKTNEAPYHITNRSNNKEFFYISSEELWPLFLDCLGQIKVQFKCDVHAFVLMNNHYHLVISTPLCNLGEAMKYLHREVARKANRNSKRINHFFGGRYRWSLIYDETYYWNALKYIFRNPVKAGICAKVCDYEFSSLNTEENFAWNMIDFFHSKNTKIDLDRDWLNEPFLQEKERAIQLALRRREFKIPRSKKLRSVTLDTPQYQKGTVT